MVKTIMIVDDDESITELYRDILEDNGHQVIVAKNGAESISKYIDFSPELVLMDLNMPMMSGCKAIWQIKEYDPNAKIEIVTGNWFLDENCKKVKSSYAIPMHRKPLKMKKLIEIANAA